MKQPWQMTRQEWESLPDEIQDTFAGEYPPYPFHSNFHLMQVIDAIGKGKSIPPRVIESYGKNTALELALKGWRPAIYSRGLGMPERMTSSASFTKVIDLRTGETVAEYTLSPEEAVIATYAQFEKKDFNTWDYSEKYSHLLRYGKCSVCVEDYCASLRGSRGLGMPERMTYPETAKSLERKLASLKRVSIGLTEDEWVMLTEIAKVEQVEGGVKVTTPDGRVWGLVPAYEPFYTMLWRVPIEPGALCGLGALRWEKAPSVTTGGKPYFWVGYEEGYLKCAVVWDRLVQKWAVTDIDNIALAYFDSAAAGKKWAESH